MLLANHMQPRYKSALSPHLVPACLPSRTLPIFLRGHPEFTHPSMQRPHTLYVSGHAPREFLLFWGLFAKTCAQLSHSSQAQAFLTIIRIT